MSLLSEQSALELTLICNVAAFRAKCFGTHTDLLCRCFQSKMLWNSHWSVMSLLSEHNALELTLICYVAVFRAKRLALTLICYVAAFRAKCFGTHTNLLCRCFQSKVLWNSQQSVMSLLSEQSALELTVICYVAAFRAKCFGTHTNLLGRCFQSEVLWNSQ